MKRRQTDINEKYNVKPVKKVELEEKHIVLRIVVAAVCILIAVSCFAYGISKWINAYSGWTAISVKSDSDKNCSGEFTFMYNIGNKGISNREEYRIITNAYTSACVEAYKLFDARDTYDGSYNLCYISQHPNQVIQVDPFLYEAMKSIVSYGGSRLYAAPIYNQYEGIFACSQDWEIEEFAPELNESIRQYIASVCLYINDKNHISLDFLENDSVRLNISDEYSKFASDNGIDSFLDFGYLKNAAVCDYLSQKLSSQGLKYGYIYSFDGYFSNLGNNPVTYQLIIRDEDIVKAGAVIEYKEKVNIAFYRSFPISELDVVNFYKKEDGQIINYYIDSSDGKCKNSLDSFMGYSDELSCLRVALTVSDIFIDDSFGGISSDDSLQNTDFVYYQNGSIHVTDSDLTIKSEKSIVS